MSAANEYPRRSFLGTLVVGAGALPVVGAVVAALRAILSPAHRQGGGEVTVCRVEEIPKDGVLVRTVRYRTRTGPFLEEVEKPVFLRREPTGEGRPERIIALSGECTHLGCPVHFEPGEGKFKCPCHGGVFTADGNVIAGPPPAPLTRLEVLEPAADGVLRIRIHV